MYRLSFTPAAQRQWEKLLRRIPVADYGALEAAIEELSANPRPHKVSKLVGERDAYRLRVGYYRIIYQVNDAEGSVVVAKVARRSEGTYLQLR